MELKRYLDIASLVLPCLGFVYFLYDKGRTIRRWNTREANEGMGTTLKEICDLNLLFEREARKALIDSLIECVLVVGGALLGIVALFV